MAARAKGVRLERAAVEGEEVRFAHDSLLEGDGFELPVPGRETVKPPCDTGLSKTGADLLGNRRFESISLQRGVHCEPRAPGRRSPWGV